MAGTVTTEWKMPKTASLLVRKVAYVEDLDLSGESGRRRT